ncbi:MAG: hypothetical protein KKB70_04050 [Proteobacteria bacterium]|nr:hypothetical protein [Pseudomonadota bacterium]MBU1612697.1 hypothetical protein [Pseudomonadota bacterium]
MAREILTEQPKEYSHFSPGQYTYFRLFNHDGDYGRAAVSEHPQSLEVHLELSRWGVGVRRSLEEDAAWLRSQADSLGKTRIVGIKQESGTPDPRWPKFTRILGFTGHSLLQTAFIEVNGPS